MSERHYLAEAGICPIGLPADPHYLDIIERAHRLQVGAGFCYEAVRYHDKSERRRGA